MSHITTKLPKMRKPKPLLLVPEEVTRINAAIVSKEGDIEVQTIILSNEGNGFGVRFIDQPHPAKNSPYTFHPDEVYETFPHLRPKA